MSSQYATVAYISNMNLCEQQNSSGQQCPNSENAELESLKRELPSKPEPQQGLGGVEKRLFTLYVLYGEGQIRYVGITSMLPIRKRLHQHLSLARLKKKNIHSLNWIRSVIERGGKVKIRAVRTKLSMDEAIEMEQTLIARYKDRLVNSHEGGFTGLAGLTDEQLTKWKASQERLFEKNGGKTAWYKKLNVLGLEARWSGHIKKIKQPGQQKYRNRRQDKYKRLCVRLAQMRSAKARKRAENPPEHEPKMERWHRFDYGVRDKLTGETHFRDLVSVRQAAKAIGLIAKFI